MAALCGWLGMLSFGMYLVNAYSSKPGQAADAPDLWPEEVTMARSASTHTLLMIVHPQCPCSRASLWELQGMMRNLQGEMQAIVLFYHPTEADQDWVEGPLWEIAESIPNTELVKDGDGVEAERFGAFTSGQVLLYDERGYLRFSGGITPSRGHMGDSEGKSAIRKILAARDEPGFFQAARSLVFGCSIHGADSTCENGYCQNQEIK